jgi:hypothetical protein
MRRTHPKSLDEIAYTRALAAVRRAQRQTRDFDRAAFASHEIMARFREALLAQFPGVSSPKSEG